jgi:hypothetical protein
MGLLPAAMRLPDDITPLGRKVEKAKPAPVMIDRVKEFETGVHPHLNSDGTKTYVKPPLGPKPPWFGMDFGAGDALTAMVTYAHKAKVDAVMLSVSTIEKSAEHKTATEVMMKQRAYAYSSPKRQPSFRDLDDAVARAAKRSGLAEVTIVRMVNNQLGGTVRLDQVDLAIEYANTIVDDFPF